MDIEIIWHRHRQKLPELKDLTMSNEEVIKLSIDDLSGNLAVRHTIMNILKFM